MIRLTRNASRWMRSASREATSGSCSTSSVSARRPSAPMGVFSSWLTLAMKSRRISSRRRRSETSSIIASTPSWRRPSSMSDARTLQRAPRRAVEVDGALGAAPAPRLGRAARSRPGRRSRRRSGSSSAGRRARCGRRPCRTRRTGRGRAGACRATGGAGSTSALVSRHRLGRRPRHLLEVAERGLDAAVVGRRVVGAEPGAERLRAAGRSRDDPTCAPRRTRRPSRRRPTATAVAMRTAQRRPGRRVERAEHEPKHGRDASLGRSPRPLVASRPTRRRHAGPTCPRQRQAHPDMSGLPAADAAAAGRRASPGGRSSGPGGARDRRARVGARPHSHNVHQSMAGRRAVAHLGRRRAAHRRRTGAHQLLLPLRAGTSADAAPRLVFGSAAGGAASCAAPPRPRSSRSSSTFFSRSRSWFAAAAVAARHVGGLLAATTTPPVTATWFLAERQPALLAVPRRRAPRARSAACSTHSLRGSLGELWRTVLLRLPSRSCSARRARGSSASRSRRPTS